MPIQAQVSESFGGFGHQEFGTPAQPHGGAYFISILVFHTERGTLMFSISDAAESTRPVPARKFSPRPPLPLTRYKGVCASRFLRQSFRSRRFVPPGCASSCAPSCIAAQRQRKYPTPNFIFSPVVPSRLPSPPSIFVHYASGKDLVSLSPGGDTQVPVAFSPEADMKKAILFRCSWP